MLDLDVPHAGCVDTAGTWGHVQFDKACRELGVSPMFGAEFSVPDEETGAKPRFWALAAELPGFYRFSSANPQTEGEVIDWRTDDAASPVVFAGAALSDPDAFDFIDLNPSSRAQQRAAMALHKRTGMPLVLTSDNDYPGPEHRLKFLAWDDSRRMTPQHLLSQDEFQNAFSFLSKTEFKQAVKNTQHAAELCTGLQLRQAPIISVDGDIRAAVELGRRSRMERGHIAEWTEEYQARINRELDLIEEKQYQSYFLVVAEMIEWAKERMLVGPARGSSAGSLVCYLMGITEVDPLVHGLIFERFIDVNRDDLPDIDIDFNDQKRHLVFEHLEEKYGAENVARIGSVSRLKPRSVIAHVGKKLGIPHGAAFGVTNVLIEYSSGDSRYGKGLEDTLNNTQPGKDFMARYPEAALMGELENHASHSGQHAAGIIVSNEPVTEYCTVRDGIAHIDKKDAEALNLLKIDALGLRTLGVIEDTGCITTDELYGLTYDDPAVLNIFNQHKFSGVFQFEGGAQRRVSIQVPMDSFTQIDHVTALARPGPLGGGAANTYINRNAGREETTYRHESMQEYLADTQGVVLYQEQVMRIVREIGDFSWEDTSVIRKAMSGRKGAEFFNRHGENFVKGAARLGIDADDAAGIWEEICSFGAWGMNKCISGDTKIKIAHPNKKIPVDATVAELYQLYKISPSAWMRQNKSMPKLLCVQEDGIARPVSAVDLIKNGPKRVHRHNFSNGAHVDCTEDHRFLINGAWRPIRDAVLGDEFHFVSRKRQIKNHSFDRSNGKGWRKGRKGGAGDSINRRSPEADLFRAQQRGAACQDCNEVRNRMEVHHNDHKHGALKPKDLAWLCSGCHKKRHMEAGDWLKPYARGWSATEEAIFLEGRTLVGELDTYDIEMPAPNHNYVLANGLVTHNSHTVSYAMISYWCAHMKHHHPLEYAAACLRHAKDDEQTVEILRELAAEGVSHTPFDAELSELNWVARDGKLLGGFTNLVGVGQKTGATYVERRNTTGLTEKDRAKLAKFPVKHQDLRPAHTLWGHIYDDPDSANVHGPVKEFADLEDKENAVVIVKLVRQERRDQNETVRLAKRGYALKGQTLFLDAFVVDDSVSKPVVARLNAKMWWAYGEKMADRAVGGQDWFLIRGRWLAQFSMMSVTRIRCLTNEEMFE